MITKETILEFMETQAIRPLSKEELIEQLEITTDEIIEMEQVLAEMEAEGSLVFSRKKRYGLPSQFNLMIGKIKRHPKGFAFLISDNPDEEDLYINGNDLGGAMNQDRVIRSEERRVGKECSD